MREVETTGAPWYKEEASWLPAERGSSARNEITGQQPSYRLPEEQHRTQVPTVVGQLHVDL